MRALVPVLLAAVAVAGCGGGDDTIARYEAACRDLPALEDVGLPGHPAPELDAAVERIAAIDGEPAFVAAIEAISRAQRDVEDALETFRRTGDPTDTISPNPVEQAVEAEVDRYRDARDAAREAGIDCPALESVADAPPDPSDPNEVEIEAPAGASAEEVAVFERGKRVLAQSGCLACHRVGEDGGDLGPDLTAVGHRLSPDQLAEILVNPVSPMPSFRRLPAGKRADLVAFMADLRG